MRRQTNKYYTRKSFSLISEKGVAAYNFLKAINENISEIIENHLIFVASKYKTKEDKILSDEDRELRAEYRSYILNQGKIGQYQSKSFDDWLDFKEKEKNMLRLKDVVNKIIEKNNNEAL